MASPLLPVPVTVVKGYECPHFVDETSLVFAVSCSGEHGGDDRGSVRRGLGGCEDGRRHQRRGARALAEAWQAPLVHVPDIIWPGQPWDRWRCRCSVVLWRMGFLPGAELWMERAVEQLRYRRDQFVREGASSEPAEVARSIGTSIPFIHGGGAVGAAAAQRWKTQVNENAKRLAFYNTQPELCHNEICGWAESSKEIARANEPGDAEPRQRAPPGRPPVRDHGRSGSPVGIERSSRSAPRVRETWPNCWTSPTSGTMSRSGWRPTPASTRARSRSSCG